MATGYTLDGDSIKRLRAVLNWWKAQPQNQGEFDSDTQQSSEVPSLTFYNGSAEEVPAFGVMAITDAGELANDGYVTIAKPSSTVAKVYAVNGPIPVATLTYGQCYTHGHCRVVYDTGTPAVDETWIPKSGQWSLIEGTDPDGWHVVVCGIVDSTNKIMLAKIVDGAATLPKFYNNYSGTVPQYGCMAVTGTDDTALDYAIPQCDRPSDTIAEEFLLSAEEVNEVDSEADPPDTGVGTYQNDGEMVLVLYDDAAGAPVLDETWGPESGKFELTKGPSSTGWGVIVAGIYDADLKILMGRVVKGNLKPFELYDDIKPGDVDNDVMAWPLGDDLARDEEADKIAVNDGILTDVRALGSSTKDGGTPDTGARGWYVVGPDGKNHILSIQRIAKTIIVANTYSGHAAIPKTMSSFAAEFTRVCDDGQNPLHGAETSLVVYNPGIDIDDETTDILCVLDPGTGIADCLYRIADVACPI